MLGGVMVEWSLAGPVAIEADGLYRRLHARISSNSTFSVVTWEFPILANYRLSIHHLTAVLEAGPSLRAAGNLNAIHPSHYGFTSGLGVEKQVGRWRLAPIVRYTHWAPQPAQGEVRTKMDQLELLVMVHAHSLPNRHPFGSRISAALVAGTNLTSDFGITTTSGLAASQGPLAN
ncbi:MAG TPA: hypothetical protein VMH81_12870 [Bryobacteraceae bacterium]|nr:hypothetical protein [Bryobacteraceae bacterium]